jgi:hypothetical protein
MIKRRNNLKKGRPQIKFNFQGTKCIAWKGRNVDDLFDITAFFLQKVRLFLSSLSA